MSAGKKEKEEPIPIDSLPLEQLKEFAKDIEGRCEQLAEAIRQLNGALTRYDNIKEALSHVKEENEGRQLLVPLTDSLYAPGVMKDCHTVLVDIGTGYFAEMPVQAARDFVARKVGYVRKNVAGLEEQLDTQNRNLQQISLVINAKQQQQPAKRQR